MRPKLYDLCRMKKRRGQALEYLRARETKPKPLIGKMNKKNENVKLRNLAPFNDTNGGGGSDAGLTFDDLLKEGGEPKPYYFSKTVTYMTRSGKVLDEDAVKRRIKVAIPIQVRYSGEGANRAIDRVILDED